MKSFIFLISLFVVTLTCYLPGQVDKAPDNRVVAEAGNLKITAQEFINRYEFSPPPRLTESLDMSLIKKIPVYSDSKKIASSKSKVTNA